MVSCPSLTKQTSMAGFFSKKVVCSNGGDRIGNEVIEGAVLGIFNLCDVLQLVIDCFYQSSLSQQDFV